MSNSGGLAIFIKYTGLFYHYQHPVDDYMFLPCFFPTFTFYFLISNYRWVSCIIIEQNTNIYDDTTVTI